ncbi:GAF domain-containing protein [Nanoarchaeota archaeon]
MESLKNLLKDKDKELSILYKLDDIRDKSKSLQQFLDYLLREIVKSMKVEMGFILVKNDKGNLELKSVNDKGLYLFKGEKYATISKWAKQCIEKNNKMIFAKAKNFSHLNFNIRNVLAVPLAIEDQVIGAIVVVNKKGGLFNGLDLKIMDAIVSQTDSAIVHMQTMDQLNNKLKTMEIINEVDNIRDETNNPQEMMAKVLNVLQKHIPTEFSAAIIKNDKTKKNDVVATISKSKSIFSNKLVEESAFKCMKQKKDCLINSSKGKVKSSFSMPIIFGDDKVFGAIVLINKKNGFNEEDAQLLHALEDQLDSALEHVRIFNDLALRNKELDILYKIDEIRDNIEDFDKMISAILNEFAAALDAKVGFVELLDDSGKEKELKTVGVKVPNLNSIVKKFSNQAIKSGNLVHITNVGKIKSALCIPLILGENVIGTFGVINPKVKEFFDIDDERLLTAVASQADTAIFEDISKRKIKDVFKRYVNENVVDQMLKLNKEEFLTGQRLHMSVSFADIRGFTSMSEKLKDPEKLVLVINEYLTAMTNVVMDHNGTLDKFVGDEVMSLFGAPVHYPTHAKVAIESAIDMQKAMKKLQAKWKKEGKIPCKIGIGINTGDMVAGNIGCEKMSDYTVLGDNVNLGARLCSAAKGDEIIVSEYTYNETKRNFKFEKLDPIMVKGKSKPINIYRVVY